MYSNIKELIIFCFIFCIILFLYLHIQFHLKTSDELEIYEIDQVSKEKLEEICDLRQPVLLDGDEDIQKMINAVNKSALLNTYPIFEVKIIDTQRNDDISLPLPLQMAEKLFKEDTTSRYFSENNIEFLNDTGAVKNLAYNDSFLRPSLVSNRFYDIIMGSTGVETPFRYDLNYRNYYFVTQGIIKVKLSPPKSGRYLYPIMDYENFEFRSPINPWSPQSKYAADFDKIKCLDIVLVPGRLLFIPAYWWYSFKLMENSSMGCLKYRTYLNNVAISPHIFMYALQNQNVETRIVKTLPLELEPSLELNIEKNNKTDSENNMIHINVNNDNTK